MCRIFFGKRCDERTLGEKFLTAMTFIMTVAFIITCATFAICTHEEMLSNYGFDDDISIVQPGEGQNWTRTGDFDFQRISSALMSKNDDADDEFVCNTNMVSKKWFVSTAHCLSKVNSPENLMNLFIRSGVGNYKENGIDSNVERIIINPLYDSSDFAHNIGLVEVDHDLEVDYGNYPFELLYSKDLPLKKNDIINVDGWGKNNYHDETEDSKFKEVQFYLINNEDCEKATKNINRLFVNQICGYQYEPDHEFCHPSEGAGVIRNGKLIAMSSWGERCIGKKMPHIFDKVETHIPWILRYVVDE